MSTPGHLVQPGLEVEDPNTLEPNPPLHPHLATWSSQALKWRTLTPWSPIPLFTRTWPPGPARP